MKQKNKLARALIVSMLLFGIVFSLAACESMYGDIVREIEEQNPQLKLPEFTGDLSDLKEKLPKETIEGKPTDFISTDITPVPPVELDPCEINGHVIVVDPAVDPTCTTSGKTEGSHCGRCSKVLVKQTVVSATGHNKSDWIYQQRVSMNSEGFRYRYCLTCGGILKEEKIPSVSLPTGFDNDGDGFEETYLFSKALPLEFTAPSTILLKGADHQVDDVGVQEGVVSNIKHYYIDLSNKAIKDEEKMISWRVNIPEDGAYEFCFDLRIQSSGHHRQGIIMQVDDGELYPLGYVMLVFAHELVVDAENSASYMRGLTLNLTAGEHIIKMTYHPYFTRTFHFRNIYLAKVS